MISPLGRNPRYTHSITDTGLGLAVRIDANLMYFSFHRTPKYTAASRTTACARRLFRLHFDFTSAMRTRLLDLPSKTNDNLRFYMCCVSRQLYDPSTISNTGEAVHEGMRWQRTKGHCNRGNRTYQSVGCRSYSYCTKHNLDKTISMYKCSTPKVSMTSNSSTLGALRTVSL